MRSRFAQLAAGLLCLGLACSVPQLLAKKKDQPADAGANEQKRAVHALNRLAFGPRPGDVQQVMAMGVDRWIDLQLHPDKIQDDAMDSRLAPLRTLHMSAKEIVEEFPDNQMVKQVMDGKKPLPSDPAKRAIYQVQMARLQDRQDRKEQQKQNTATAATPPAPVQAVAQEPAANEGAKTAEELAAAAAASPDAAGPDNSMNAMSGEKGATANDMAPAAPVETKPTPEEEAAARAREDRLYADLKVQSLVDLPPDERYKKVMAMKPEEQIAFADTLRGGKGQDFLADMNPRQKETLMAMNNPQGVVAEELAQAKLLRAIYSERQLEEVMTDFWFNHFNVFMDKGVDRLMITSYERDVIRPHALGKFEDLLVATAKSPAMLFYLDNWLSVGPDSPQGLGIPAHPGPYARRYPQRPRGNQGKRQDGLNENYGRELLELHTLSVNGGYLQQDVTEVAKVFTGWTIEKPYQGGGFKFEPRMHEPGPKVMMGHRIKPKGEGEGLEVLHRLATNPQTAHFISLKLAERFVADDPPPTLVDRMAKTFLKKKGDIREVLSTLFHSPEFWDDTTYRAKVKTPLEFVASAVRATGAEVDDAQPLVGQLNRMGMPLYGAQPPTGYSMKADTWVSSSALLTRMNFALALTGGKIKSVKVDVGHLAGNNPPNPPADSTAALSSLENVLLDADVSKQTHDSIMTQVDAGTGGGTQKQNNKADARKETIPARSSDVNTMAGLLLGSPEFQRR